jgi:hypothetical protein
LRIADALVSMGFTVYAPMNPNSRFDFIVDTGDRLLRCQCKTGRLRKGVVIFSTESTRVNTQGWFRRAYDGEIDFFLVYCPDTGGIYAVAIDEAATGSVRLRIESTANNQRSGVRWAKDFELPSPFAA